eukprot:g2535.t1
MTLLLPQSLSLLLLILFQAIGITSSLRVAIIGGGIGGASVAYFTKFPPDGKKEKGENVEFVVYERRDYVGGRLKHTYLDNQLVELGGDAWSTAANAYVVQIAKELGGGTSRLLGKEKKKKKEVLKYNNDDDDDDAVLLLNKNNSVIVGDPLISGVGVYIGANKPVLDLNKQVLSTHLLSDFMLAGKELSFLSKLKWNYFKRGKTSTFTRLEDFLSPGGIDSYITESAMEFFKKAHVSQQVQDNFLEPLQRVIYDQPLSTTHAFASVVSMTSAVGADSFPTGNSDLVTKMFQAANASINLGTKVTNIRLATNNSGFIVTTTKTTMLEMTKNATVDNISSSSSPPRSSVSSSLSSHHYFDRVVLAAPYEFLNISMPANTLVPKTRPFTHWYVTLVKAKGLRDQYFGGQDMSNYTNIVTTETSEAPFNVIQQVTDPVTGQNESYWKLFSNGNLSDSTLSSIFDAMIPSSIIRQHWPYTFPHLRPTPSSKYKNETNFQPIILMPGLFYVNGIESLASAMECSIIGGRNIAMLLAAERTRSS